MHLWVAIAFYKEVGQAGSVLPVVLKNVYFSKKASSLGQKTYPAMIIKAPF